MCMFRKDRQRIPSVSFSPVAEGIAALPIPGVDGSGATTDRSVLLHRLVFSILLHPQSFLNFMISIVGNRNSLSALFLPKLSAEISAERLSVFRRSFGVSAETAIFGRNSHFRQKYHLSADILAN